MNGETQSTSSPSRTAAAATAEIGTDDSPKMAANQVPTFSRPTRTRTFISAGMTSGGPTSVAPTGLVRIRFRRAYSIARSAASVRAARLNGSA